MDERPIGVFDSSVGGISVLRELIKNMPNERFIYYGDTKNAPYGVRDEMDIQRLTERAASGLLERGIKALVIACNTATSAAAPKLRSELQIPVIGMEPALKPAAESLVVGKIAVMATPATLRQTKFQKLYSEYGQHAVMVPCPGLMEFVERFELDSGAVREYLKQKLYPDGEPYTEIVLGCTHYVFLKKVIAELFPSAGLFDGNLGTVRRLQSVLQERGQLAGDGEGSYELSTSGDPDVIIPVMERLLKLTIDD